MKPLRKRIKSHPISDPTVCLIGSREPCIGMGPQPMPMATHYISGVELGAACRYKFW